MASEGGRLAGLRERGGGEGGVVLGLDGGAIRATPLAEAAGRRKTLDPALFELAGEMC